MRKLFLILLLAFAVQLSAQTFKYYNSNTPKFLSGTDTLKFPFTGGVNVPQFSNIDYNNDGRKDLFVFDRGTNKVLCFANMPGGFVHTPQYEALFPEMIQWALLRDFDGDGREDIFTEVIDDARYLPDQGEILDFANCLRVLKQVSTPSLQFKSIIPLAKDTGKNNMGFNPTQMGTIPPKVVKINRVDIPAIDDVDNDGDLDLICFQGAGSLSPQYIENYKINPFNVYYPVDSPRYVFRDDCWGGIQFDAQAGKNRFNIHLGRNDLMSCTYRLYGKAHAKDGAMSTLMLDMNGDSVKDMIYGDMGYNNLIILYNGRNQHPYGRDSIVTQDSIFPRNTVPVNFINAPAPYFVDIDADGVNEMLVSTNNPLGVKSTNNVWVYENAGTNAKPVFDYQGNDFFMYHQTIDLGLRTVPVVIDVDGDSKLDLLVATGGSYEQTQNLHDKLVFYKNTGSNAAPVYQLIDSNFLHLTTDTPILEMFPAFGDLTGDGKPDLVIGTGNGKLEYYINQSIGANYHYALQTRELAGIDIGNNAAPQLFDLDRDNRLDLLVGNKNGTISYFRNAGTPQEPIFQTVPDIDSLGGIVTRTTHFNNGGYPRPEADGYAVPHACELDGDGSTIEMLVGTNKGEVWLYQDVSATIGAVFSKTDTLFAAGAKLPAQAVRFGMRSVPCAASMDTDDKPDILIGNLGGGLNYYSSIPAKFDGLAEVENNETASIKVHPNPATHTIWFSTQDFKENMSYEVVNIVGQVMLSGNVNHFYAEHTIDTSPLKNGLYFIRLKGKTQAFTGRFFISN